MRGFADSARHRRGSSWLRRHTLVVALLAATTSLFVGIAGVGGISVLAEPGYAPPPETTADQPAPPVVLPDDPLPAPRPNPAEPAPPQPEPVEPAPPVVSTEPGPLRPEESGTAPAPQPQRPPESGWWRLPDLHLDWPGGDWGPPDDPLDPPLWPDDEPGGDCGDWWPEHDFESGWDSGYW